MKIITKYILKEFIPTFIMSFFFFFFMFIVNIILVNIQPLLVNNVPLDIVFMLVLTSLPPFLIFCLPFGILLATLMTMGRFSTDNEIVAFRAVGFSIMKIFTPIFICSVIITGLGFIVTDRLLPIAKIEENKMKNKIANLKPTLDFKSKTVKSYAGKILFTDIVNDTNIEGLLIIDKDKNGQERIISTRVAEISSPNDRKGTIQIKMTDAMFQFENKDRKNEFNYGYSKETYYYISMFNDNDENRNIAGSDKTTYELVQDINKSKIVYEKEKSDRNTSRNNLYSDIVSTGMQSETVIKGITNISNYVVNIGNIDTNIEKIIDINKNDKVSGNYKYSLIEFYKKFALPVACLIFAVFSAPIGIYSRRAGRSIGFIVGLFLCAIYWFSYVIGGQILGQRSVLPPFIAIFYTNLVFLVIGVYFLLKRLKE